MSRHPAPCGQAEKDGLVTARIYGCTGHHDAGEAARQTAFHHCVCVRRGPARMAIYSCNLASVGRTTHAAGTAGCHLAYIGRDGAEPVIEAHGMPLDPSAARSWMDREEANSRANARVIDKVRIAIPRELDSAQRLTLVRDFVRGITQDRVPWYLAIHQSGEDSHNPHAHIVLRDRDIETGKRVLRLSDSARDREAAGMTPKAVDWIRERWEHHANAALKAAGHDLSIDRRTLEAQGIDREPTIHVGPRAYQIDEFVQRPRSQNRTNGAGREIRYAELDQGRTRKERHAEIVDLNLERQARSPHLETRVWAQFERGQRRLDAHLESELSKQARQRTQDMRKLKGEFRERLAVHSDIRRAAYLDGVVRQRGDVRERVCELRVEQRAEREALHARHSGFWPKIFRAVDITGATRRRHKGERRALSDEHRRERGALARQSRAEWIALKHAIDDRFAPERDELLKQRQRALQAMRDMHGRAEAMADGKRQLREAHRERDRRAAHAMIQALREKERAAATEVELPVMRSQGASRGAFDEAQRAPEKRGASPGRSTRRGFSHDI
jgi:hypothetical protein